MLHLGVTMHASLAFLCTFSAYLWSNKVLLLHTLLLKARKASVAQDILLALLLYYDPYTVTCAITITYTLLTETV